MNPQATRGQSRSVNHNQVEYNKGSMQSHHNLIMVSWLVSTNQAEANLTGVRWFVKLSVLSRADFVFHHSLHSEVSGVFLGFELSPCKVQLCVDLSTFLSPRCSILTHTLIYENCSPFNSNFILIPCETSATFLMFHLHEQKKREKHQRWTLQQSAITQLALDNSSLMHSRRNAWRVSKRSGRAFEKSYFSLYLFISLQNNFFLLSSQQGVLCPVKVYRYAL